MKKCWLTRGITISLTLCVVLLVWVSAAMCDQKKAPEIKADKTQFVAYYFFTNKRCRTCKTIEQLTREAIEQNFKDQLASGRLKWQPTNVEESGNKHFIQDFQLYTKSVVIAEYKDDKPVRWVNLEKIWQLYGDREKYFDYLAGETKSFMEKN